EPEDAPRGQLPAHPLGSLERVAVRAVHDHVVALSRAALGGVDPGEVVVGVMPQPHLHAPEAARDMLACFPFQLAWVVGPEEAACVCGHLVPFCTEQLVDRLAGGFATEIPQR